MDEPIGLRWTGNAVIDMGVAAAVLSENVDRPEDITRSQWNGLMHRLERDYASGLFRKPSMILLTNNTFENPSFGKSPESRLAKIAEAFNLARGEAEPQEEVCTFFAERQAVVQAVRSDYPLLMGTGQINFYPHGTANLPLSELAYGCILALPLVSPIVSGRFMVLSSIDRSLFLRLCSVWKTDVEQELGILRQGGEGVERKAPKTHLLSALKDVYRRAADLQESGVSQRPAGLTLYHLSNSGNGAAVDIYTVPPHVLGFIRRTQAQAYRHLFGALSKAFWRNAKGQFSGVEPEERERPVLRNMIYESLPGLPREAPSFIRRFFLKYVRNRVGVDQTLIVEDRDLWLLLHLFLTEVMHMHKDRIEVLKHLADELASEIKENNDVPLYRDLMGKTKKGSYAAFSQLLARALRKRLERTNKLMFTSDQYLLALQEGDEIPRADWLLARDLVRVRCLEKLHELGFDFGNAPKVEEEEEEYNTTETEL